MYIHKKGVMLCEIIYSYFDIVHIVVRMTCISVVLIKVQITMYTHQKGVMLCEIIYSFHVLTRQTQVTQHKVKPHIFKVINSSFTIYSNLLNRQVFVVVPQYLRHMFAFCLIFCELIFISNWFIDI